MTRKGSPMPDPQWMREAQSRCDAATKGPWDGDVGYVSPDAVPLRGDDVVYCVMADSGDVAYIANALDTAGKTGDNAAFVAHARMDLPKALAMCRELAAVVREVAGILPRRRPHQEQLFERVQDALAAYEKGEVPK